MVSNSKSTGLTKAHGPFDGVGESSAEKTTDSPDPRWPYLSSWSSPKPPTSPQPLANSAATNSPPKTRPPTSSPPPLVTPPEALVSHPPSNLQSNDDVLETEIVICDVTKSVLEGNHAQVESSEVPAICNKIVAGKDSGSKNVDTQSPSLKGAWAKKLSFVSPSRCGDKSGVNPKLHKPATMEDDVRFPWAAKMNPASRNLYRATEPEYLEDGTPKVTIPQHVLLQGLENQKEYVLGQFYKCSPPSGGLIFAVFNKLWGMNCKITIRKLGESNYLFHIPDASTRTWVLQRGLWHVDDCLMFVAPWTPEASLSIPKIKTIPVWVTLKNIPNILYSIPGISHISSVLGAPMATHKPRLDPILMGEAKILVEVELSKAFPSRIAADDENGFISMVDVEYAWLPSKCDRCGQLGHKVKRCLQAVNGSRLVVNITTKGVLENDSDAGLEATINASNSIPISAQSHSTAALATIEVPCIVGAKNDSVSVDPSSSSITEAPVLTTENVVALTSRPLDHAPFTHSEPIESLILEAPISSPVIITATAQEKSLVLARNERLFESDFGTNKFASLIASEVEEDSSDPDIESDPMDLMTPSRKRILQERPVKPTTKFKEMHMQTTSRGRGNRGHGNRGGRG